MQQITFRMPEQVISAIDSVINPLKGETMSDFLREAALQRLKTLGIEVKKNE